MMHDFSPGVTGAPGVVTGAPGFLGGVTRVPGGVVQISKDTFRINGVPSPTPGKFVYTSYEYVIPRGSLNTLDTCTIFTLCNIPAFCDQGPVVQSIVSICRLHYHIHFFIFLEKCESILQCKRFSHFFNNKYQRICYIYILNFEVTIHVTNNVIYFEQLAPAL